MSLFDKEIAENTTLFDWENFEDLDVKRQFSKLSTIGTAKLSEDKIERVSFKKIEIFFKIFRRTSVLFVGPLIPIFWTCAEVCSGF